MKNRHSRSITLVISFVLLAGVCLLIVGRLDVVVEAKGIIVTDIQLAKVQHFEGGIVEKIHVKVGDIVNAGQSVVGLNEIALRTDVNELESLLFGHRINYIRLKSELDGAPTPKFSNFQKTRFPDLVKEGFTRFNSRKIKIETLISVLQSVLEQRRMEVQETQIRVSTHREVSSILNKQIDISLNLLKKKISTRYNHLELERETAYIGGLILQDEKKILRLHRMVEEAEARIKSVNRTNKDDIITELAEVNLAEKRVTERYNKIIESLSRMDIKAPITGKIQKVYFPTIGGVVPAGATVVEIIPTNAKLMIRATVGTNERGYIDHGSKVTVGLATDISREFQNIKGRVVDILQDTTKRENQAPVYEIYIEIEKYKFENEDKTYPLFPGMEVISYIILGDRSIMEYLLSPFFQLGKFPLSEA